MKHRQVNLFQRDSYIGSFLYCMLWDRLNTKTSTLLLDEVDIPLKEHGLTTATKRSLYNAV